MAVIEIAGTTQGIGLASANLSQIIALSGISKGVGTGNAQPPLRVFKGVAAIPGEIFFADENGVMVPVDVSAIRDGRILIWRESQKKWVVGDLGTVSGGGTDFDVPFVMGHPASSIIATGAQGQGIEIPVSGTVIGWTLAADTSTTSTVDVKKATYANWPTTVSIWGTKPSLTATRKNQATGLNIPIVAGDMLDVTVDANNNAKQLILSVKIRRS